MARPGWQEPGAGPALPKGLRVGEGNQGVISPEASKATEPEAHCMLSRLDLLMCSRPQLSTPLQETALTPELNHSLVILPVLFSITFLFKAGVHWVLLSKRTLVKVVKTDFIQKLLQKEKRDYSIERSSIPITKMSAERGEGVGGWKITKRERQGKAVLANGLTRMLTDGR